MSHNWNQGQVYCQPTYNIHFVRSQNPFAASLAPRLAPPAQAHRPNGLITTTYPPGGTPKRKAEPSIPQMVGAGHDGEGQMEESPYKRKRECSHNLPERVLVQHLQQVFQEFVFDEEIGFDGFNEVGDPVGEPLETYEEYETDTDEDEEEEQEQQQGERRKKTKYYVLYQGSTSVEEVGYQSFRCAKDYILAQRHKLLLSIASGDLDITKYDDECDLSDLDAIGVQALVGRCCRDDDMEKLPWENFKALFPTHFEDTEANGTPAAQKKPPTNPITRNDKFAYAAHHSKWRQLVAQIPVVPSARKPGSSFATRERGKDAERFRTELNSIFDECMKTLGHWFRSQVGNLRNKDLRRQSEDLRRDVDFLLRKQDTKVPSDTDTPSEIDIDTDASEF